MYASFLNLPAAGRDSRALHLELFTVPSSLTTFYELVNFLLQNRKIVLDFTQNRWWV
jgi:hypothetical protein